MARLAWRGATLFFFSSRRRQTRWNCDWSSDVCSSDLWSEVATVKPGAERYVDPTAKDGTVYRYEIRTVSPPDTSRAAATTSATPGTGPPAGPPLVSDPVASHDNWFRPERTNSFIASVLFLVILLGSIGAAKSGKNIFI